MKNKALVLGANYYIGLSIIRCLGAEGVEVAVAEYNEERAYGLHSKYVSEKLIGPNYKEEPEGFLKLLIDYGKKQDLKPVLFPSADPYVEYIDQYFDELKEYYLIAQTEKGLYTKAMNKDTLALLAKEYGMPIPETVDPKEENFEEKVESEIGFPCLVKPIDSPTFVKAFERKLFKAKDMEQLKKYVSIANKKKCDVIIQRMIAGFDDHMYTYDAHLDQDSKVTHWLTCQKLRQYPINYGASVYTVQRYVPELHELGAPFLEKIGWKGFAEIEFKKDEKTGNFYLIEINVRTTNLNVLLEKAGINMPFVAYSELTGNKLENKAIKKTTNIAFWYAYEDFFAVREYVKRRQLKFGTVLKSYFRKKAHSTFDPKDMKPFLLYWKKKVFGSLGRRVKRVFKK